MSRNEALTLIILILMITPALAKEVAYVYGEFKGHTLDSGNITEYKGSDLINFTVAGGLEGESVAYNTSRTMDSIRSEIKQKINKGNQPVRDEGRKLVGKRSGPRRIDQLCSIYDQLVYNWSYVEDWKGLEEFQYSNHSLMLGKNVDSEGQGDCDDFSILLAALVESIGATPRIIFAYRPNGGHAYAEVYLGNIGDQVNDVDRMIEWLRNKYDAEEINTHADFESGDVWLNLDWWREPGGAIHPGGPFFTAAKQTRVYPTSREPKAPLTALNEPPRLLKFYPEKLGLNARTAGSIITFNANATDPENDSIYFMFRLNNENVTTWKSTSSWQAKNNSSWSWETNSSNIGSNIIEVWVRDGNHADEKGFDNKSTVRVEIKPAVPVDIWSVAPRSNSFSWNPQDFAGFYYDIDDDLGNETLFVNLTNGNKLSGDPPYGLVYITTVGNNKNFKFRDWGDYEVIGFFTRKYFAGYNPGKSELSNRFFNESQDSNSLSCGQIEEILIDDDTQRTITSSDPLRLREGYELAIKSLDIEGNKVYLELSKDGQVVESSIVIPPNRAYDTFSYPKSIGSAKIAKVIEVHLKNSFRGADEDMATVDRIWQASDWKSSQILKNSSDEMLLTLGNPLRLEEGYELAIKSLDVSGNKVYLELSKDGEVVESRIVIPPNRANETFSFSKSIGSAKIAKIIEVHLKNSFRGANEYMATVDRIWQASDNDSSQILKNSSDEIFLALGNPLRLEEGYELAIKSLDVSGNKVYLELSKGGQVVESSIVIPPNRANETFSFSKSIGSAKIAKIIEVHLKNSFRGADVNLATVERIWQASDNDSSQILKNSSDEIFLALGNPLGLEEGYELAIKSMDIDGNKVYLELSKGGQVVESSIVIPPNRANDTFSFSKSISSAKIAKIIEVHLKNSFRGADVNLATVERIWQASDNDSSQILKNSPHEMLLTLDNPLRLEEGYELAIKSMDIDGNKVYLELSKDGKVVESSIVIPPNRANETFSLATSVGEQEKLVTIGVHFKNAFRGAVQDLATVDGTWQISDTATQAKVDNQFYRMTINFVDPINGIITMNNRRHSIVLNENNEYSFIPDLMLSTFDQERLEENNPIRFALFKKISLAGDYIIRGSVALGNFSWYPENFSGFFYDIDQGFGTEMLHVNLSHGRILSGDPPYGVIYTTTSQAKNFKFHGWGTYGIVGFLGKKCFTKYINNPDIDDNDEIPFAQSRDSSSLAKGQLEEILKDENEEISLISGKSLKLAEGYELIIRSIDSEGKVSLELIKNGYPKDLMIVEPSKNGATMADKTYYYETNVGSLKGLTIIAVHFKKAIRVGDRSQAIVDGIWQISDTPTYVEIDTHYDKMRIVEIDPFEGIISMDNRDEQITLTRDKDISLVGYIHLKTADSDTLRYYIYKAVTIGEE